MIIFAQKHRVQPNKRHRIMRKSEGSVRRGDREKTGCVEKNSGDTSGRRKTEEEEVGGKWRWGFGDNVGSGYGGGIVCGIVVLRHPMRGGPASKFFPDQQKIRETGEYGDNRSFRSESLLNSSAGSKPSSPQKSKAGIVIVLWGKPLRHMNDLIRAEQTVLSASQSGHLMSQHVLVIEDREGRGEKRGVGKENASARMDTPGILLPKRSR